MLKMSSLTSVLLYDSALIFRLLLHFNGVMKNASINLLSSIIYSFSSLNLTSQESLIIHSYE